MNILSTKMITSPYCGTPTIEQVRQSDLPTIQAYLAHLKSMRDPRYATIKAIYVAKLENEIGRRKRSFS